MLCSIPVFICVCMCACLFVEHCDLSGTTFRPPNFSYKECPIQNRCKTVTWTQFRGINRALYTVSSLHFFAFLFPCYVFFEPGFPCQKFWEEPLSGTQLVVIPGLHFVAFGALVPLGWEAPLS